MRPGRILFVLFAAATLVRAQDTAVETVPVANVPAVAEPVDADLEQADDTPFHAPATQGNVTLDLVDVEIGEAVKLITKLSGASVIGATTNMQQKVSATIVDKPWKPTLEMLLEQCNLRLSERQEGSGIYIIGPRVEDADEPWITETFSLSYLRSHEAAALLTSLLGGKSDSQELRRITPRTPKTASTTARATDLKEHEAREVEVVFRENGRVVSYPGGNSVVVSTTAIRMEEIRRVLDSIDKPRPQIYIEAKIVEISSDASKNIGVDWSMLDGYEVGVTDIGRGYSKEKLRERGSSRFGADENAVVTDHRGRIMSAESAERAYGSRNLAEPQRAVDALAPSVIGAEGSVDFDLQSGSKVSATDRYAALGGATMPGGAVVVGANQLSARFTSVSDIRNAVFSASDLSLVISALQTSDDAFLVSNPKVIVANEELALIDIARKEPYVRISRSVEGTGDNTTATISTSMDVIPGDVDENKLLPYVEQAFFTYGIRLQVIPRINNASNITVTIAPSLSDLHSYYEPVVGMTRYPVIESKSVRTIFSLGDGQTAVIGGLTKTAEREVVKKVPLLGDIPFIGKYFFTHTSKIHDQRETIIFVTVGIVNSEDDDSSMKVPEASRLIHNHVTPDGRLIGAEQERVLREMKMQALEQGEVWEPMGD